MNTTLLIIVFVALMLLLALLPWMHRAWTERRGSALSQRMPFEDGKEQAPESIEGPKPSDDSVAVATQDQCSNSESHSLRTKISKARGLLSSRLRDIRRGPVGPQVWDQIEELLILADVGVQTTFDTVGRLRQTVEEKEPSEGATLLDLLKKQMIGDLSRDRELKRLASEGRVPVWLFVGVNGVGKTTSIGKVARRFNDDGLRVLLAAGDTFRAAATEQLEQWAETSGSELVRGSEGADPSSVIFDAAEAALARKVDVVLADTAGRLHNKVNLMEELAKVRRVADREPGEVLEVLLVIDATTGQNGLNQAREFSEAVDVTGVVLTKLDGSAKGGIVFAIEQELGLPVKLVGLGEGDRDLVDFDPEQFVEALFGDD